jgi:dimethylhistidine N-methyltransferase
LKQQSNLDTNAMGELNAGLLSSKAHISPKYFYDAQGSRLFDAITALDEYYPTRTEAAIFDSDATEISRVIPTRAVLIDLGAGNCAKAERLFPILNPDAYLAIDISSEFLFEALQGLGQRHPELPRYALAMDFSARFELSDSSTAWLAEKGLDDRPRVVFYPGSSIGNFAPHEALGLLQQVRAVCAAAGPGGGLLIGVDRVKSRTVLEAAYDDALGVTAAFNLNLLRHLNRILGADFVLAHWKHVAFYCDHKSRIEMHLESLCEQTVRWPGAERLFRTGERIHTEHSYKWRPQDFQTLLTQAGFTSTEHWTDAEQWFSVFWATA